MIEFVVNQDDARVELPGGMVALDFLRRHRGLSGVKEGCREGDCGACMVLLGEARPEGVFYRQVNSCLLPLANVAGRHLVTIEGLNQESLNPIQQAFVEEGAAQCGFCTPGFMVSFLGFLLSSPRWDADAGLNAIAGNICRCTGHVAIRRAVGRVCLALSGSPAPGLAQRVGHLVERGWLPQYFLGIAGRLRRMSVVSSGANGGVAIGGWTDLMVQRPEELCESQLTLLSRREELRGVRVEEGRCILGAATRWADLEDSPVFRQAVPGAAGHLRLMASRPIRQRATVGGNLVNASPIGDLTVLLLALDAELTLADGAARRALPLREFFLGYKKLNKRPQELVAEVSFRVPPPGAILSFEKVSRRQHLDIASVNSAMLAQYENGRLAAVDLSAGGVGPIPLRLARTCAALEGRALTGAVVRTALEAAESEVAPISDVRGSAVYKRQLLRRLLTAHLLKVVPELEEELAL